MVLLTLSKTVNRWLGPFLLRQGIKLRFSLSGGVIRDSPAFDALLLLPLAQRLISLEVHEETRQALNQSNGTGSLWNSLSKAATTADENNSKPFTLEEETAIRLNILERYLRPALVPNEQWSNVRCWQFHSRILRWVRAEVLNAKFGPFVRVAIDAFPTLRESPQIGHQRRGLLSGQLPLDSSNQEKEFPSSSTIKMAFHMDDWAPTKNLDATNKEMARIANRLGGEVVVLRGGGVQFSNIPLDSDLTDLSLEEIVEVAGGFVTFCGPFSSFCEQAGIYQLWSKEYVAHLGDYVMRRVDAYSGETIILEVGAGDGLLLKALREYCETNRQSQGELPGRSRKRKPKRIQKHSKGGNPRHLPLFVATDDASWRIPHKAMVESMSVEEAMEHYADEPNRQIIVLCSWMPQNQDWSNLFREKSVDEYILIGECDDGQCGDNWLTWGNYKFNSDVDSDLAAALSKESKVPATNSSTNELPRPYVADGYRRRDLDELLPYQFSRYDCEVSKTAKTVSFRRTDKVSEHFL